ncbi:MAG: hypothetical protein ACI915_003788 [Gammaproteobacteria bacterium]|jgi:hypothetical protein
MSTGGLRADFQRRAISISIYNLAPVRERRECAPNFPRRRFNRLPGRKKAERYLGCQKTSHTRK